MSTSKNVNAAKTTTKTKKNDASSKTTTTSTNKLSIFKKAFIRHKRRGNDPNRIDDLLVGSGGCEDEDDSIIDVKRIHYLQQSRRLRQKKLP